MNPLRPSIARQSEIAPPPTLPSPPGRSSSHSYCEVVPLSRPSPARFPAAKGATSRAGGASSAASAVRPSSSSPPAIAADVGSSSRFFGDSAEKPEALEENIERVIV